VLGQLLGCVLVACAGITLLILVAVTPTVAIAIISITVVLVFDPSDIIMIEDKFFGDTVIHFSTLFYPIRLSRTM